MVECVCYIAKCTSTLFCQHLCVWLKTSLERHLPFKMSSEWFKRESQCIREISELIHESRWILIYSPSPAIYCILNWSPCSVKPYLSEELDQVVFNHPFTERPAGQPICIQETLKTQLPPTDPYLKKMYIYFSFPSLFFKSLPVIVCTIIDSSWLTMVLLLLPILLPHLYHIKTSKGWQVRISKITSMLYSIKKCISQFLQYWQRFNQYSPSLSIIQS